MCFYCRFRSRSGAHEVILDFPFTRGLSRPGLPSPVSLVRVDIGDRGVEGSVFYYRFRSWSGAHEVVLDFPL